MAYGLTLAPQRQALGITVIVNAGRLVSDYQDTTSAPSQPIAIASSNLYLITAQGHSLSGNNRGRLTLDVEPGQALLWGTLCTASTLDYTAIVTDLLVDGPLRPTLDVPEPYQVSTTVETPNPSEPMQPIPAEVEVYAYRARAQHVLYAPERARGYTLVFALYRKTQRVNTFACPLIVEIQRSQPR